MKYGYFGDNFTTNIRRGDQLRMSIPHIILVRNVS